MESVYKDILLELSSLESFIKDRSFDSLSTSEKDALYQRVSQLISTKIQPYNPEQNIFLFDTEDKDWKINHLFKIFSFLEVSFDVMRDNVLDKEQLNDIYNKCALNIMDGKKVIESEISYAQMACDIASFYERTFKSEYHIFDQKDGHINGFLNQPVSFSKMKELHDKLAQELALRDAKKSMQEVIDSPYTIGAHLVVNESEKVLRVIFDDNKKPNLATRDMLKSKGHYSFRNAPYPHWQIKLSDFSISYLKHLAKNLHITLKDGIYSEDRQDYIPKDYKEALTEIMNREAPAKTDLTRTESSSVPLAPAKTLQNKPQFIFLAPQDTRYQTDYTNRLFSNPVNIRFHVSDDENGNREYLLDDNGDYTLDKYGNIVEDKDFALYNKGQEVFLDVPVLSFHEYFEKHNSSEQNMKDKIRAREYVFKSSTEMISDYMCLCSEAERHAQTNLFNTKDHDMFLSLAMGLTEDLKNCNPLFYAKSCEYGLYLFTVMKDVGLKVNKDTFYEYDKLVGVFENYKDLYEQTLKDMDILSYIAMKDMGKMEKRLLTEFFRKYIDDLFISNIREGNNGLSKELLDYLRHSIDRFEATSRENKDGLISRDIYDFCKRENVNKFSPFCANLLKAHDIYYQNDENMERVKQTLDAMTYVYYVKTLVSDDYHEIPHQKDNMPFKVINNEGGKVLYALELMQPKKKHDNSQFLSIVEYPKPLSADEVAQYNLTPNVITMVVSKTLYHKVHASDNRNNTNTHASRENNKSVNNKNKAGGDR